MSNTADMFKKLAQNRQKTISEDTKTQSEQEIKPVPESERESKTDLETTASAKKIVLESTPEEKPAAKISPSPSKKRGRPATGKRSDPSWIGRTYYIRKETDFDIEDELIALKRKGINLDKSELVDFLLAAWVKWRKGENIDGQISEISPRRKDELL